MISRFFSVPEFRIQSPARRLSFTAAHCKVVGTTLTLVAPEVCPSAA